MNSVVNLILTIIKSNSENSKFISTIESFLTNKNYLDTSNTYLLISLMPEKYWQEFANNIVDIDTQEEIYMSENDIKKIRGIL